MQYACALHHRDQRLGAHAQIVDCIGGWAGYCLTATMAIMPKSFCMILREGGRSSGVAIKRGSTVLLLYSKDAYIVRIGPSQYHAGERVCNSFMYFAANHIIYTLKKW